MITLTSCHPLAGTIEARGPAIGALVDNGIFILGPVELRMNGQRDSLGTAKERLTLTALAVDVGRPITLDALVHRVWDDSPPAKPRASLHAYAARIRRRLRGCCDGAVRLTQQAHTYTLDMDPDLVDCHRFQRLAADARALSDSGDTPSALDLLREADLLWRGEPLPGLPGLWAEGVRANLAEKRLAATLARVGIELRGGRYAELIADLSALFEAHPTDETVAAQLMTAAYGCGRQADALRTYESVRRRLGEELGADPGEALVQLHRLILRRAPVTDLLPPPESAPVAPHTLPSHGDLVGRDEELNLIEAASAKAPGHVRAGGGAVIALQTITGMAGVGKSLLALHAARRLASRFPDGQVHLDLRGHSPGQQALSPEAALLALLRTFGVAAADIPAEPDERVALWRTVLSTRRAVIVLDDAVDAEHVRPLIPGASASLVIITSRRRLTGLPGVRAVLLDVLSPEDSITLFRRLVGEKRIHDPAEVAEIVRLCGHLPLAVELAAGRLVSRPSWTTSHLVDRLSRGQGRLGEIRDGFREVARAFEMSHQALPPDRQQAFRLLSRHFGAHFGAHTAAALTGLPLSEAERVLDSLLDDHLITEPMPDRYHFHDLVGEYARTLTMIEDSPQTLDLAFARVIHFYLQASEQARRLVSPRRSHGTPEDGPGATADPSFELPAWRTAAEARRWLTLECSGLLAAEYHARMHGHARQAALLARHLTDFLDEEGLWSEAQRMHGPAARYWRSTGESRAEAQALVALGTAQSRAGRYARALASGRRALDVARTADDPEGEADARHLLGVVHWNLGRLDEARAFQETALELRRRTGNVWLLARSQNNLGITALFLGNHAESKALFLAALAGFRQSEDRHEESRVLNNLSDLHLHMGERESALRSLRESLDLMKTTGTDVERAIVQVNLANAMAPDGNPHSTLSLYREALSTFRRLGDMRNTSVTLQKIGTALGAAGSHHESVAHHRRALDVARGIGAAHEEAQALRGLGASELRLGHMLSAIENITQAWEIARRIGAADEAAQALSELREISSKMA